MAEGADRYGAGGRVLTAEGFAERYPTIKVGSQELIDQERRWDRRWHWRDDGFEDAMSAFADIGGRNQ